MRKTSWPCKCCLMCLAHTDTHTHTTSGRTAYKHTYTHPAALLKALKWLVSLMLVCGCQLQYFLWSLDHLVTWLLSYLYLSLLSVCASLCLLGAAQPHLPLPLFLLLCLFAYLSQRGAIFTFPPISFLASLSPHCAGFFVHSISALLWIPLALEPSQPIALPCLFICL